MPARARAELPGKIARWSEKMGVAPTGFKVTAARKRYGSCSAKNSLCFSVPAAATLAPLCLKQDLVILSLRPQGLASQL